MTLWSRCTDPQTRRPAARLRRRLTCRRGLKYEVPPANHSGLRVLEVHPGSLLGDWSLGTLYSSGAALRNTYCREHMPRDELVRGDLILTVNGERSLEAMREALNRPHSLEMLILRPPSAFKHAPLSEQLRDARAQQISGETPFRSF